MRQPTNWWGLLVFVAFVAYALTALIGTFAFWNLTCVMMLLVMSILGAMVFNYLAFRNRRLLEAGVMLICGTLPTIVYAGYTFWRFFIAE